jgi:hypothetical protein
MWCLFVSLDQRYGCYVWQESSHRWKGEGDRIPGFGGPVICLDLGNVQSFQTRIIIMFLGSKRCHRA